MDILIGLIPALAWGIQPIAATKIGGKPSNQILGMTAGTFVIAVCVLLYLRPEITTKIFILSFLSGALWVIGQIGQFQAFVRIGVSRTMPVSAGLQLIGTSLIGVLVFGEWPSFWSKVIGFTALGAIIIGIFLTSMKRGNEGDSYDKKALSLLFFTTFGYLAYSTIPAVVGTKGASIFFPQALGMFCAAVVYVLVSGQSRVFREAKSWMNMLTGLFFAVAALAYIISAQRNGIATGFVLAQLSVVISTLAGIVILKEKKSPFELKAAILGLILIVMAGIATAFI